METLPVLLPLNEVFHTPAADWRVEMLEEPTEFSQQTCVRYKYKFTRRDQEDRVLEERHITVMVPKSELIDEHQENDIRSAIRDRLTYTSELESTFNPYGCELEPPNK